jgi:hypothetical protein
MVSFPQASPPTPCAHLFPPPYALKHVIEGKYRGTIEVTGREGERCKQLPDKLKVKQNTGN